MTFQAKPAPHVILTRPAQDAAAWVEPLQDAGFNVSVFPLLELSALMSEDEADKTAKLVLQSQAVMFVSANAVRFLAAALINFPAWRKHFEHAARAWCTGPGTAAALQACGIPSGQIDQPSDQATLLDSESLWQVVSPQVSKGMTVLIVRGADETGAIAGRHWLTQQLENSNVHVQAVAAYRRMAVVLGPEQKAKVMAFNQNGAVWLFSSSAAIEGLMSQSPALDWSKAKVVVTHPRMAEMAKKFGCLHISIASPGIRSMLASIKSLA